MKTIKDAERIAYLEKAYAELHRDTTAMMGEDKERIKVLEDALKEAIGAGEYVVKLCEDDYKCGASPNPLVKSMPSAVIAECYAAMNFLYSARAALEVK